MVFQWFWYHKTITIECFFTDWPLTSMVFQWFSTNSGTMVNDGFGLFKRPKKLKIATDPILGQMHLIMVKGYEWNPQIISESPGHFTDWRQNQHFQDHILLPSPSFNGFQRHHHHWMEWFGATIGFNGFSVDLGSRNHWFRWLTMVVHHWSNDGMVTCHRRSLNKVK